MSADRLEQRIAYTFQHPALLKQALTHRSHGLPNNERLEFLGDSIVNCVIAHLLYERFPATNEGVLSRLRANLICQQSLFEIAEQLDMGSFLLLGEGERRSGGRKRPSILADALESLFGAIFLDGGFDAAQQVIRVLFDEKLAAINPDIPDKDAKTLLQEYLQAQRLPIPEYNLTQTSGQAHEQLFHVECRIAPLNITSQGIASNRRAAEQAAATTAWQLLETGHQTSHQTGHQRPIHVTKKTGLKHGRP